MFSLACLIFLIAVMDSSVAEVVHVLGEDVLAEVDSVTEDF